jgi:hypothetical protein
MPHHGKKRGRFESQKTRGYEEKKSTAAQAVIPKSE